MRIAGQCILSIFALENRRVGDADDDEGADEEEPCPNQTPGHSTKTGQRNSAGASALDGLMLIYEDHFMSFC